MCALLFDPVASPHQPLNGVLFLKLCIFEQGMWVTEVISIEVVNRSNTLHLLRFVIENAVKSFFGDNLNLILGVEPNSRR